MKKYHKLIGFTLFELMVVIGIIAIIIAVSVVSYTTIQKKSRDSRRKQDLLSIQKAFEAYYVSNDGSYPAACSAIDSTYLPNGMPTDPKSGLEYTSITPTPDCTVDGYCICVALEAESSTTQVCDEDYYCVNNVQ